MTAEIIDNIQIEIVEEKSMQGNKLPFWACIAVGIVLFVVALVKFLFPATEAELTNWWYTIPLALAAFAAAVFFRRDAKRQEEAAAQQRRDQEIRARNAELDRQNAAERTRQDMLRRQQEAVTSQREQTEQKVYVVAGTLRRQAEIQALGIETETYHYSKREIIDACLEDEELARYVFPPLDAQLVPEPDNQYDPNAVKVIVNGVHMGYIKREDAEEVRALIQGGKIGQVYVDVVGGPYKRYDSVEDTIEKKNLHFGLRLTVCMK